MRNNIGKIIAVLKFTSIPFLLLLALFIDTSMEPEGRQKIKRYATSFKFMGKWERGILESHFIISIQHIKLNYM